MNYHIARKHSKTTSGVVHKCRICHKTFHSFYLFREHKRKEHGAQTGSNAQIVNFPQLMGDVVDI